MILRYTIPDTAWRMDLPTDNLSAGTGICRYTLAEAKRIVAYVEEHPQPRNVGILICLCTGLRIGEICGLKWEDVDIESRTITVRRTLERIYDYESGRTVVIENTPKTSTSNRTIPIVKQIFAILKNFKRAYRDDYYVCTCAEKPTEPRTLRNYYKIFILDKVKLDHCIKFHVLRHTFVSTL